MAGYGLTQAVQNFYGNKNNVEDRYRREAQDAKWQQRYDEQIARQKQQDEQNRINQEQNANFAAQDQAMQAGLYDAKMQEYNRAEKLRKDTEQAALDSRRLSTGYDQADFQPEDENGVMQRARTGLVHEPTRLAKMQQVDPVHSGEYGAQIQKMKKEGVIDAANLVRQGRIQEAEDLYNSTGVGRVRFFVDPKTKKVMAHEDDGAVSVFDPDVILKKASEPYTLKKDEIRYGADNKPIAYGAEADPKARGLTGGDDLITIDGIPMKVSEADTWFRRDNNIPDESTLQNWELMGDETQKKQAAAIRQKLSDGAVFSKWLQSVGAQFPKGMLGAPKPKNTEPVAVTDGKRLYLEYPDGNRVPAVKRDGKLVPMQQTQRPEQQASPPPPPAQRKPNGLTTRLDAQGFGLQSPLLYGR